MNVKVNISVLIIRILGKYSSRFLSLEQTGFVKDGTLDMWLVLHKACVYLLNLLQQSPTAY